MKDADGLRIPEEQSEARDAAAAPDEKKKSIDELIEQFNRDNPAKNPKKTYRGVY